MRRVVFHLGIGCGGIHKEIVEYEDGESEDEIEQDFLDWRNGYIDGAWWDAEESD